MKKRILLLFVLCITISCIKEDYSNCNLEMYIVFELADQYSNGNYDSDIENDVHLQLFKQGYFSNAITIPYDQIKGSKVYTLKDIEPQTQLVAYAIPNGQAGTVRVPSIGESYCQQVLQMPSLVGSSSYKPNEGSLYLGREYINKEIKQDTTYIINMIPCYAKVTVIIMDAVNFSTDFPGIPSIGIEGTAGIFRIPDSQTSVPVQIISEVILDNQTYTTGIMYLLPEVKMGETISVQIYNDTNLAMYIHTDEKSVAGKEIIIRIYPNSFIAEITVDGWTYKTQVTTP